MIRLEKMIRQISVNYNIEVKVKNDPENNSWIVIFKRDRKQYKKFVDKDFYEHLGRTHKEYYICSLFDDALKVLGS